MPASCSTEGGGTGGPRLAAQAAEANSATQEVHQEHPSKVAATPEAPGSDAFSPSGEREDDGRELDGDRAGADGCGPDGPAAYPPSRAEDDSATQGDGIAAQMER